MAIVNRAFANWGLEGRAIGRVIRIAPTREFLGNPRDFEGYPSSIEVRIVGVVENISEPRLRSGSQPFVYIPAPLYHDAARILYVRSRVPVHDITAAIARIVRETDARVPINAIVRSLSSTNSRYPCCFLLVVSRRSV